jgi:hypothetical protein
MLGTRASYINEWADIRFTDEFVDHTLMQMRSIFDQQSFHGK